MNYSHVIKVFESTDPFQYQIETDGIKSDRDNWF